MAVILFVLGWALFALMELAPGDIVDQMVQQQLMSQSEMTPGIGGGAGAGAGGAAGSGAGTGAAGANGGGQAGKDSIYSEEQLAHMRAEMGLDQPFTIQYFKWLNRVFIHHDL